MFGVNQIKEIATGWTNYALGREKELSEYRMNICMECPIYNSEKDSCDSKKCWDKVNEKLVDYPGKDIVCGCGCYMKKKTSSPNSHCVLGKW